MAVSVKNKVKKTITNYKAGKIFFPSDFHKLGTSTSIRQALNRLENNKFLLRLAHGIYLYPKKHPSFGVLYPSTEEIAIAITKRDKARIIPTGIQALNKLGLSTQVPMKVVFLTDGAARIVKVGKRTISFKKASPKNLLAQGEISSLVIQALKTIGQKKLDGGMLKKINLILEKEKKENILNDAKLAPAWINKILTQSIK